MNSQSTQVTPAMLFDTLQIRVEFVDEFRYLVTCTDIDGKENSDEFAWPFSMEEELNWIEALNGELESYGDTTQLLEQVGAELFDLIFKSRTTYAALDVARRLTRHHESTLRLVLVLKDPRLERLPWESLYERANRSFIARDPRISLMRRVATAHDETITFNYPLRILAVVAQPQDGTPLNVQREQETLKLALSRQLAQGSVQLDWLSFNDTEDAVTLDLLTRWLNHAEREFGGYDVLHFIGHAEWDDAQDAGVIWLEDRQRQRVAVTGEQLGAKLPSSLKIVLLNACEGARSKQSLPFRSISAALFAYSDVATVIASQMRLSDRSANEFTQAFYTAVGGGQSVEEAMIIARGAIARSSELPVAWVAPVVLTRTATQPLIPIVQEPHGRALRGAYFFALLLLTALSAITVVTLIRVFGWQGGISLQLAIWAAAGALAYFNWRLVFEEARLETVAALLLATVMVAAWFVWQPVVDLPSQGDVTIQFEPPPELIRGSLRVVGTVDNLPSSKALWLLVQAEGGRTYVAGDVVTLMADGQHFEVAELRVGPPVDRVVRGQRYIIQPVVVDDAANEFLFKHADAFYRFFHPDFVVRPQPTLPNIVVTRR